MRYVNASPEALNILINPFVDVFLATGVGPGGTARATFFSQLNSEPQAVKTVANNDPPFSGNASLVRVILLGSEESGQLQINWGVTGVAIATAVPETSNLPAIAGGLLVIVNLKIRRRCKNRLSKNGMPPADARRSASAAGRRDGRR